MFILFLSSCAVTRPIVSPTDELNAARITELQAEVARCHVQAR
jgi:hypothetical protein